jgi:hypothetical protein
MPQGDIQTSRPDFDAVKRLTSGLRIHTMPKVLNQRKSGVPRDAVYIGRPSKWGNPFAIGRDGTREEVILKYENYVCQAMLVGQLHELEGKDLVCWCAPLACHGDVLLRLANGQIVDTEKSGG